jgi:hypothetical protein
MPRSSRKKKKGGAKAGGGSHASPPLNPLRRGMPAQDSILGVKEMKRGGQVYRVIKTTEIDEYEEPAAKGRRKQRADGSR